VSAGLHSLVLAVPGLGSALVFVLVLEVALGFVVASCFVLEWEWVDICDLSLDTTAGVHVDFVKPVYCFELEIHWSLLCCAAVEEDIPSEGFGPEAPVVAAVLASMVSLAAAPVAVDPEKLESADVICSFGACSAIGYLCSPRDYPIRLVLELPPPFGAVSFDFDDD
jgi:hypothetical protein